MRIRILILFPILVDFGSFDNLHESGNYLLPISFFPRVCHLDIGLNAFQGCHRELRISPDYRSFQVTNDTLVMVADAPVQSLIHNPLCHLLMHFAFYWILLQKRKHSIDVFWNLPIQNKQRFFFMGVLTNLHQDVLFPTFLLVPFMVEQTVDGLESKRKQQENSFSYSLAEFSHLQKG